MKTEPQKEHRWLQKLVGEWTCESEATMEPGKPPERFTGDGDACAPWVTSGCWARAAVKCRAVAWRRPC